MTPTGFLRALAGVKLQHVFNPYTDRCVIHDKNDAPNIRTNILLALIEAARKTELDSIWIGRDLGYRGGRRTGLALTDDVHLCAHTSRWDISPERPTIGEPIAERTATVTWSMISRIEDPIFLWNVFPLHPHHAEDPFSNRPHCAHERGVGEEILRELIRLLRPKRLIAIGNDAMSSAFRLGETREIYKVRHPSYGGTTDFVRQLRQLYDVAPVGLQLDYASPQAVTI